MYLQPRLFTRFSGLYLCNRSQYVGRCELAAANGFAIRENTDGGGRNEGEELFEILHMHDL
jgi:hypothetical protein